MEDVNINQNNEVENLEKCDISLKEIKKMISTNRQDEATKLLNERIALTNDMECHFLLAKSYMKKGNYEEAISNLLPLLNSTVVKPYYVYSRLCSCYFNLKRYSESFEYGVKAYDNDEHEEKNENHLYFMILCSANNCRRYKEGVSFIEKYPIYQSHGIVSQVIRLYHGLKKDAKAYEIIKNTGFESVNDAEKIIEASAYYAVGQIEQAREIINNINNPDNFTLFIKGKIEYRQSNFLESERIFSKLVSFKYHIYKTAYWLVKSQIRLGKIEEAKNNLKIMPADFHNTKFLKATLCIYSNELDEAESLLEELSENFYQYRWISLIYLASIDIRKGKYAEALNTLAFVYFNYITELDKFTLTNINMLINLAKMHLGLETQKSGYMLNQIVDYSEDTTLERMKGFANGYYFYPDADLKSIFYKLQELIADEYPKICACSNTCDTYVVDFPSAGIFSGKVLDKMQVITVIGTKNIVSFYPVNGLSYWKNFDIDSTEPVSDVKKLTQTGKI